MHYPSGDVFGMENYSQLSKMAPFLNLPIMEDYKFVRFFHEVDDQIRIVRKNKEDNYVPNIPHNIDSLLREMERQAKTNYDIVIPFVSKMEKFISVGPLTLLAVLLMQYNIAPELFTSGLIIVILMCAIMATLSLIALKLCFREIKKDVLRYKFYLDHKEEFSNLPIPELQNNTIDINIITICDLSLKQLKGYLEKSKEESKEKVEEKSAKEKVKTLVYNLFHQNEANS